jgi:3-dehydroquinate synthase
MPLQGKNLIGAFYQPKAVLADTSLLASLPDRELRAGYAEMVKYGLLGDAAFFDWLDVNSSAVLALEPAAIMYAIHKSCSAKARIVEADEREAGKRALLNLGHTFAHAFEAEADIMEACFMAKRLPLAWGWLLICRLIWVLCAR